MIYDYITRNVTCQVAFIILYVVVCFRALGYNTFGDIMDKRHNNNYIQLGLNIAFYRKLRGISQNRLAELVNISRTHMSRIETADCAVSLDVIFDICNALDIPPVKLFEFRK